MMNTRPQITSVEETIRIPDWRSASPKNFSTRRVSTSRTIREVNLTISPNDSIQPRGVAIRPSISCGWASLGDRGDLWVRREQGLRERVVEREHAEERDHDRLVDGAPHPLGPARGGHALVTADDRDDRAEQRALDDRSPEIGRRGVVEEGGPEGSERGVVDE